MVKKMFILTLALVFALSGSSFAGTVVLTDADMDGVNAGEWVVLKDSSGNETTADVYLNNNTLWLLANSQKDIQAVSNANAIDSAVAVQSNVARIKAEQPQTNVSTTQSNSADVTNYRPASSSASSFAKTVTDTEEHASKSGSASSSSFGLSKTENYNSASSSSSSSSAALNYDEELDVVGALAGSYKEIGKGGISGGVVAGSLVVDYDKEITASASTASASASSKVKSKQLDISKESSSKSWSSEKSSASHSKSIEKSSSSRDSKGANNHILLDETSQQSIKAVSNLNAVASGVAVQTNIASNMGVNGTVAQSNSASVSSGF